MESTAIPISGQCDAQGAKARSRRQPSTILTCAIACTGWLCIGLLPAMGLEEPRIWRDPDTGCAYFLTPQGGVAPRYLRDGSPDCPDAQAGSRLLDDTARGIARGLETLQREVERLRERFNAPERHDERL
jgi:hypothetical protein